MKCLSLVVEALKDIYCYVMLDELEEPCSVYICIYKYIYTHIIVLCMYVSTCVNVSGPCLITPTLTSTPPLPPSPSPSPSMSPSPSPSLCASAGIHDHVGHVHLHDVVLRVEVHHGEWPSLGGHTAGRHGRVDAVDLQLAEDGGVEGGGDARRPRQVLRTLAHAVVHVVALGRDDPVLPLDVFELDVEVPLAAHGDVVPAPQRPLPQRVFGLVVAVTHLGHQEGLVVGVVPAGGAGGLGGVL